MFLNRRRTLWAGIVLVVAVAFMMVWRARRPVEAELAVVTRGLLSVSVDEQGTTRVRQHVDVSAASPGRWLPGRVAVGDSVRAGDPLGELKAPPLDTRTEEQARARIGSVEANQREVDAVLSSAEEGLREAQRTLTRVERLAGVGGMSLQDLDRARSEVVERTNARDAAAYRARAAAFELRSARAALSDVGGGAGGAASLAVRSPVEGVVLRVYEEHERVVPAGTPLLQVGDPRFLEIVIPVLSTDAVRVRVGQLVRAWAGGGDTLRGRVTRVEPSASTRVSALGVEEQRVQVIAQVDTGRAWLGDAFRVEARIITSEVPDAVIVPASAVAQHDEKWTAFVVVRGVARSRELTVSRRGVDHVEVLAGVAPGDTVVTFPGDAIKDGVRVRQPPER